MEITYQNRMEDLKPLHDFQVKSTKIGKIVARQEFRAWIIWVLLISSLFGSIAWGISGKLMIGLFLSVFLSVGSIALKILISEFKPIYHSGMKSYQAADKFVTQMDWFFFQLPRTVSFDENWLESRTSEAEHRWKWGQVDEIGITTNYIFVIIGNCYNFIIPKRAFSSDLSFIEFGRALTDKKNKSLNL